MGRSLVHLRKRSLNHLIRQRSRDRHIRGALRLRSSSAQPSATSMSAFSSNAPFERMSAEHNPSMRSSLSSYSQRHRRNREAKKLRFRLKSKRVSIGNPIHRHVRCHENDLFPPNQCQMACVATHRFIKDASYMDRAMLELIARFREGLMLIRSRGRFALVHSVQLHDRRS